jgi:hypothetical protein
MPPGPLDPPKGAAGDGDLRRLVGMRVRKVSALAFGIATGLVCGLALFLGTNVLVVKGGPVVGPHLGLLGHFFPGYEVTFAGSLVGFLWAGGVGFLLAWTGGSIYNAVAALREKKDGR